MSKSASMKISPVTIESSEDSESEVEVEHEEVSIDDLEIEEPAPKRSSKPAAKKPAKQSSSASSTRSESDETNISTAFEEIINNDSLLSKATELLGKYKSPIEITKDTKFTGKFTTQIIHELEIPLNRNEQSNLAKKLWNHITESQNKPVKEPKKKSSSTKSQEHKTTRRIAKRDNDIAVPEFVTKANFYNAFINNSVEPKYYYISEEQSVEVGEPENDSEWIDNICDYVRELTSLIPDASERLPDASERLPDNFSSKKKIANFAKKYIEAYREYQSTIDNLDTTKTIVAKIKSDGKRGQKVFTHTIESISTKTIGKSKEIVDLEKSNPAYKAYENYYRAVEDGKELFKEAYRLQNWSQYLQSSIIDTPFIFHESTIRANADKSSAISDKTCGIKSGIRIDLKTNVYNDDLTYCEYAGLFEQIRQFTIHKKIPTLVKGIFNHRSTIASSIGGDNIDHDLYKAWQIAYNNISSIDIDQQFSDDEAEDEHIKSIINCWRNILNSKYAYLVVLKGFVPTTVFMKHFMTLISDKISIQLFLTTLFPISFVFLPTGVKISIDSTRDRKQAGKKKQSIKAPHECDKAQQIFAAIQSVCSPLFNKSHNPKLCSWTELNNPVSDDSLLMSQYLYRLLEIQNTHKSTSGKSSRSQSISGDLDQVEVNSDNSDDSDDE